MNEQISTLKDDLAFMRNLAEDGRSQPSQGGRFLVGAGAIYAIPCLVQWMGYKHLAGLDPQATSWSWLIATVIWIGVYGLLVASQKRRGVTHNQANRLFGAGWGAIGAAILVFSLANWVASVRLHSDVPFTTQASAVLAFYGAAWLVSAATLRKLWMLVTGLGSFIVALALAWLVTDVNLLLGFAAALVLLLVLPGLRLMQDEMRAAG